MVKSVSWPGRCVLAGVCLIWAYTPVQAAIYHYIDDTGRKIFVGSSDQIPAKYADQVQQRADRYATPEQQQKYKKAEEQNSMLSEYQRKYDQAIASVDDALKKMETPVQVNGNQVVVPVTIVRANNSITAQLVLDTGATSTVLHRSAIESLRGQTYRYGEATVANGSRVKVDGLNVDELQLGPYTAKSLRISVIDHPGGDGTDGLLGMDFLRQVKYKVDFDRSVIIWQPDEYQKLQDQRAQMVHDRDHPKLIEVDENGNPIENGGDQKQAAANADGDTKAPSAAGNQSTP